MNVIVHFPVGEENQQELRRRLAAAHGSAILKYIERLPCPAEQKEEILAQIIRKM